MIIKLILLAALSGLALAAVRVNPSPAHLALRRLVVVALLVTSGLAVLFPDGVTQVAHAVGVGRGADLVLYTLVVVSAMSWLGVYRRINELDERIAELVREQAVAGARSRVAGDVDAERL
jgi:hypothetical protein